jgi:hypothetical protein
MCKYIHNIENYLTNENVLLLLSCFTSKQADIRQSMLLK